MASENFDSDEQDEIQRLAKAVASVLWTDEDADNLLETDKDGIDVSTVNTDSLEVGGTPISPSPTRSDSAQTFQESDLSKTLTDTVVSSESISLADTSSTADRGEDNNTGTAKSTPEAVWINPNVTVTKLDVTISSNTPNTSDAPTRIGVWDGNGTILASKTGGPWTNGDVVTIDGFSLSSGTDYYIAFDNQGSDYDYGYNDAFSSPVTSSNVDIIGRGAADAWDGTIDDTGKNNPGIAVTVTAYSPASSGSAILEWPYPADLYEWLTVTYTQTLDGETVDVFVAYSDDGGSTWTRTNGGNPIDRQYDLKNDSNISDSSEVRIEAELSRSDTSNNPTLDSAYRTWQL